MKQELTAVDLIESLKEVLGVLILLALVFLRQPGEEIAQVCPKIEPTAKRKGDVAPAEISEPALAGLPRDETCPTESNAAKDVKSESKVSTKDNVVISTANLSATPHTTVSNVEPTGVAVALPTPRPVPTTTRFISRDYGAGMRAMVRREYPQAAEHLARASQELPTDPVAWYCLAAAQHGAGNEEVAFETLKVAVRIERRARIRDWGRTMQRLQGWSRIWVDTQRHALLRSSVAESK